MTIEQWLEDGKSDAYRRKLPELADLLQGLSQATAALRAADWNDDASAAAQYSPEPLTPTEPATAVRLTLPHRPRRVRPVRRSPNCPSSWRAAAVRSERLTEDALAVIAARNPRLNAFIAITADEALARARDADRDIAGGRYLRDAPRHSALAEGHLRSGGHARIRRRRDCVRAASRERHAPIVSRLADAGAVFVGKHQPARVRARHDERGLRLGTGAASHRPTRARRAARAAGRPSPCDSACRSRASAPTPVGRFASRPPRAASSDSSRGGAKSPADGVVPLSRQLDHVGPLARSVADAAIMYERAARRRAGTDER